MMSTIARRLRPERSVTAIIAATRGTSQNHVMSPAGMWRPAAAPANLAPFAVGGTRASSGMPQLDFFTYTSQYTWLVVFFFGYYILLFNNGLPKIARILKTRRIIIEDMKAASGEGKAFPEPDVSPLTEAAKASTEYLNNHVNGVSQWTTDVVKTLQKDQLGGVNKNFLASVGEVTLAKVIREQVLNGSRPGEAAHTNALYVAYMLRAQRSILGGKEKKGRKV